MNTKSLTRLCGALAVAACSTFVVACGSSSKSATTNTAAGAAATANAVTIQGFAFHPGSVTVKVGTAVTWTNTDSAPHSVQWNNNAFPTSATLHSGGASATYSNTFSKPGTYSYICGIHNYMTGKVTVTP